MGGALARLEAPCSEFTHEIQVILYNGMSPGGESQQRFQTILCSFKMNAQQQGC